MTTPPEHKNTPASEDNAQYDFHLDADGKITILYEEILEEINKIADSETNRENFYKLLADSFTPR